MTTVISLPPSRLKSIWPLLLVLLLGLFFFPLRGTWVTPDGSLYLVLASNLKSGLGYVDAVWMPATFRGPGFPALIALGLHIWDDPVQCALYVVRIFFIGNLLVVYCLAQKFSGHLAGAIAALLVLTSHTIHFWSSGILLDNVMPFFILLSNVVLFMAIQRESVLYFAISGLILGMGFLVKEVAGLYVVLPILLWIFFKPFRQRKNLYYILVYVVSFSVLAVGWLIYAATNDVDFWFFGAIRWVFSAGFQPVTEISSQAPSGAVAPSEQPFVIFSVIADVVSRFIKYYEDYFVQQFAIAPLMVISWISIFYRALRYHKLTDVFLTFTLLPFIPLMLFLAKVEYRAGQTLYVYFISYFALAYLLTDLLIKPQHVRRIGVVASLVIFTTQLFYGSSAFVNLLRNNDSYGYNSQARTYTFSFWQSSQFHQSQWVADPIREAGVWLKENLESEDIVISDWQWRNSYYLFSSGNHQFYPIEYISSRAVFNVDSLIKSSIRFMWSQGASLSSFSEGHFLSQINQLQPRFIILGAQRSALSLYLRSHPDVIQVTEFGDSQIQIFQVVPEAGLKTLDDFPVHASSQIKPYLLNLRMELGLHSYNKFVKDYFIGELNLTDDDIALLEHGTGVQFRFNEIFSSEKYANHVGLAGPQFLSHAILTHEKQAANFPQNPWVCMTLMHLYQENQEHELAVKEFRRVIALAEAEPLIRKQLVPSYQKLSEHLTISENAKIQQELLSAHIGYLDQAIDDLQAYWALAELYLLIDRPELALDIYSKVQNRWPNSAGTTYRLAKYYHSQGQLETAKNAYKNLLTLPSDDQKLPEPAKIHIEIGRITLAQAQGKER